MLYKCKNCGGELHYDPNLGKLKCDFCDSVYDVSEYEELSENQEMNQPELPEEGAGAQVKEAGALQAGFDKATDDTTDIKEDLRLYQCPHCGAEVVTDKTTSATHCIFCNTPLILQENMTGSFAPEYIIPFEVEPSQVKGLYEQYIKSKPFYPKEYSVSQVIRKIKAVYLPFWLYDTHTSGELEATGERTFTHTRGDWIITEHDVYNLRRQGEMDFAKIPVIASKKTPKDAMDSIEPYDYSKMVPFQKGYLPGFLAERYDLKAEEVLDRMHERAAHSFDARLSSTLDGFSSIRMLGGTMSHQNDRSRYVLLPAYILFMDYEKDEDALIAVNGQTGKVSGNIPIDRSKLIRFALSRFLIAELLLLLIGWSIVILL